MMTEAEKVSELHQEVKNSLINEDFEKVKNWQKDLYHKQMMGGFKETKEADEGFKKAQKPWAKKLKEVRKCAFINSALSLKYLLPSFVLCDIVLNIGRFWTINWGDQTISYLKLWLKEIMMSIDYSLLKSSLAAALLFSN